jgi:hypothetical protein
MIVTFVTPARPPRCSTCRAAFRADDDQLEAVRFALPLPMLHSTTNHPDCRLNF